MWLKTAAKNGAENPLSEKSFFSNYRNSFFSCRYGWQRVASINEDRPDESRKKTAAFKIRRRNYGNTFLKDLK